MKKRSILEYVYEHPFALIIYNHNKWYSLRPCGKDNYWIETNEGEGTEVAQGKLYKVIDKLFKEEM